MRLSKRQKDRINDIVKKELSKRQDITLKEAQMIVNRSSLKEKFDKTPAFVAHCSAEQLVDLVIKESGLTLV